VRLFVAIEFSDRVRSVLRKVQEGLRPQCDGVRWIPAEQVHVTVKFLGEVPDKKVNDVATAVTRAVADVSPFTVEIGGCGCFPPRGRVRIVWAGMREATGELLKCAQSVEEAMADLGFPKERRRFSPHVTIGRVREDLSGGRNRSAVEAFTFEPVEQEVDSITLMSSVLSSKGPTYTPVSTTNLG